MKTWELSYISDLISYQHPLYERCIELLNWHTRKEEEYIKWGSKHPDCAMPFIDPEKGYY
jgi:hypothetical protein